MDVLLTLLLYYGAAVFCAAIANYAFNSKKRYYRIFFKFLIFIIPVMIATFRECTGTDTPMYIAAYKNFDAVASSRSNGFEIGFQGIIYLLNRMNLPYQALLFVMSALTVGFTLLFINNERSYIDVKVAIFLFLTDFYFVSFNALRQAVVVAVALYAISI